MLRHLALLFVVFLCGSIIHALPVDVEPSLQPTIVDIKKSTNSADDLDTAASSWGGGYGIRGWFGPSYYAGGSWGGRGHYGHGGYNGWGNNRHNYGGGWGWGNQGYHGNGWGGNYWNRGWW